MNKLQSGSWSNPSVSWIPSPLLALQQHLLTVPLAIVVVLVVFYWHTFRRKDRHRRPPGPRPWPVIGNLAVIGPLPHRDFQKLAKQYGPIFRLLLGSKETIIVSSPKIAEEILKTHDIAFASRPKLTQFTIMSYGSQTVITAPYGPFWRHARKVFSLELLTNTRIQQFQNIRKEEVSSALHSIFEECKSGKPVCLSHYLKQLAMNNITRMIMNKSFLGPKSSVDPGEATMAMETLEEVFKLNGSFIIGDYIPILKPFDLQGSLKRMRAVGQKNDKFFQKIIDDRRQTLLSSKQHTENEAMDFVDKLLTRPTADGEKPWTDTQIKGILMDTVNAGSDTASVTVEWTMAELVRHPHVLKKAQDELDTVVGQHRLVEETDTPNLKYLRCILMEALRLHPAGPMLFPHECREAREVAGYHIPEKSQVHVNVYAIGRDPEVWERPLEFYPERFLSTTMDMLGQDFKLLPFGSGRRMCPGKNLALTLVDYILAAFLQAYDWTLPPGVSPEDVDLGEVPGAAVYCMRTPIEVIASPRLPMNVYRFLSPE